MSAEESSFSIFWVNWMSTKPFRRSLGITLRPSSQSPLFCDLQFKGSYLPLSLNTLRILLQSSTPATSYDDAYDSFRRLLKMIGNDSGHISGKLYITEVGLDKLPNCYITRRRSTIFTTGGYYMTFYMTSTHGAPAVLRKRADAEVGAWLKNGSTPYTAPSIGRFNICQEFACLRGLEKVGLQFPEFRRWLRLKVTLKLEKESDGSV